jgi:hypothetical protein
MMLLIDLATISAKNTDLSQLNDVNDESLKSIVCKMVYTSSLRYSCQWILIR